MKRLILMALLVSLVPALAWGQEVFTGTWKVNLANVKFPEKPDETMLKDGRFQCSTCVPKIDVKADGTDQPVSGSKYFDTVAVKVVNDHSIHLTYKRDGKPFSEATQTVSADGNSLTAEFKSYPPKGEPVTGKVASTRVGKVVSGAHAISGSWRGSKAENISENALTVTFKGGKDGLTMSAPTGESYDAKFDGKEYAVIGDPGSSIVILKRVNDRTVEETIRRSGKVVTVTTMTVTADGKTMNAHVSDKERGTTMSWTAQKQ